MATQINDTGIFLPAITAETELQNHVFKLVYGDPALTDVHEVLTGIKDKKQIVFVDDLGLFGKKVSGCTPSEMNGLVLSDKHWDIVLHDARMKHCHADTNLQNTAIQKWSRVNPDYFKIVESSNNATGDYIIGAVANAMPKNILVKAWFSEKLASVFPAGNFKIGTDLGLINSFNGLFHQIFNDGTIKRFTVTKNAGANYVAQTLATGDAIAIFKGLFNIADSRLRKNADARFLVTSSLYMGLLNDLEDKQFAGGFTNITENGQTNLSYNGIPVVEMEIWDRYILELQDDGTKTFNPHRAVLTTKFNIPIGTPDLESLSELNAFYDAVGKQNIIDLAYGLDAKVLESYLITVAY